MEKEFHKVLELDKTTITVYKLCKSIHLLQVQQSQTYHINLCEQTNFTDALVKFWNVRMIFLIVYTVGINTAIVNGEVLENMSYIRLHERVNLLKNFTI